MQFDEELIAAKLRYWRKFLDNYQLPAWDDIPDIGLYMEQVLVLLRDYLEYLPPELQGEPLITAAAINNYVRKDVMPKPIKKRYYRTHLAWLIIICSLKQSLSIPTLQKILPISTTEDELRTFYESYRDRQITAARYFTEQASIIGAEILNHPNPNELAAKSTTELIMFSAIISGFSSLLAEKLLQLDGKTLATEHTTHKLSAEEYEREFGRAGAQPNYSAASDTNPRQDH